VSPTLWGGAGSSIEERPEIMQTLKRYIQTGAVIAVLGLLHQSSLVVAQAGDTKPLKESNVLIFQQEVAPGSFLQPEFEAIRAVRGLEDGANVYAMTVSLRQKQPGSCG